jgi:hypothetical protein
VHIKSVVLIAFVLSACGSKSHDKQSGYVDPTAAKYQEQQRKEQAKIASIEYPACPDAWNGDRLSECGARVLKKALTECQVMSRGPGVAWIDEYTGDSWQWRAGGEAASIDERAIRMRRANGPYFMETFAYALGDGTANLGHVTCELSAQMHLTGII